MNARSDEILLQIVDAALADAAARSGSYLACRPGCAQCCIGAFAINALDAQRLQRGYRELSRTDAERSLRLGQRVMDYIDRTAEGYPGDKTTGALDLSNDGQERFEAFANEEVCPVLDPETKTCDLYQSRPMTCRVFGPPVRVSEETGDGVADGLGVCELCFVGATPEEIAACEMVPDPENLEETLLHAMAEPEILMRTTVAYALFTQFANREDVDQPDSGKK